MKHKNIVSLFLCVILLCASLAGCGNASKAEGTFSAAMDAPAAEAPGEMYQEEMGYDSNGTALSDAGSGDTGAVIPENRKWIVTVDITAETDDLDALTAALNEKIQALGGYVEDQNVYNGSTHSNSRYRDASMTIRIPAGDVDQFTEEVAGIANVVRRSKNLEDITLNYVATENRVTALKTEEARLLELLAQAETMSDLLEIEGRLTDVRYELENYSSRLRVYDNKVDFATVYLSIEEVQEYTPVEEPTLWERIRNGFTGSLKGLGNSIQDLLVMLIVSVPFLVVYGGIAVVVVLVVRKLRRNRKEKKNQKQASPDSES